VQLISLIRFFRFNSCCR